MIVDKLAERYPLIYQLCTTRLKLTLTAIATLFLSIAAVSFAQLIQKSEERFTPTGQAVGGDFVVFHHLATKADDPDVVSVFEMETLRSQLQASYPGKGSFNFAWMYPPPMLFVVAPLAWSPYLVSYALWVVVLGGIFLFVTWRLTGDRLAVYFVAASPATFQAIITGQNGFLSATLIAIAAAFADRRPILAGIAAGLLTVKPQLGLLVPIAFAAAGCWRAFFAAATTAVLLAAASVAAFGPEIWVAFIEAATAQGERMSVAGFPIYKLVSPFGLVSMLGAPAAIAVAIQLVATAALAVYAYAVWRHVRDWDLRVAALATAAVLATPYAFYYELVVIAPALALVGRRADREGWLKFERTSLAAAWFIPLLMPGGNVPPALSVCSVGAILGFLVVARRTLPAVAEARMNTAFRSPVRSPVESAAT